MAKRASCPLFPVIGTITAVGPSMPHAADRVFRYLEICQNGGDIRRLTIVRAVPEIASLIEQHVTGIFLFWQLQGECRLWCIDRADGPQCMDSDAMRSYIMRET